MHTIAVPLGSLSYQIEVIFSKRQTEKCSTLIFKQTEFSPPRVTIYLVFAFQFQRKLKVAAPHLCSTCVCVGLCVCVRVRVRVCCVVNTSLFSRSCIEIYHKRIKWLLQSSRKVSRILTRGQSVELISRLNKI